MQKLWVGIIHHVCGDHAWAEGHCHHEPMSEPGEGKQWIDPTSPAADQLRDIIFDNGWLNSLQYYTRNRHTGKLEVSCILLFKSCILVDTMYCSPSII